MGAKRDHDPDLWLETSAAAGDGTWNPDMAIIRSLRTLIWLQTRITINEKRDLLAPSATTEIIYPSAFSQGAEGDVVAEVVERDMLEVANELHSGGYNVAVLNMANAFTPGGGYKSGAGAQEENLHRRSDACRFIAWQRQHYPIPAAGCLLSRNVTVFRGKEKDGYPYQRPFQITVLSCAACSHPRLTKDLKYHDSETESEMKNKIDAIIAAAMQSKCNALVLSAFGCGAFGNPPEEVARMFWHALRSAPAPVPRIIFCIINDHNARRHHNPNGNFQPFSHIFSPLPTAQGIT